MLARNNVNFYTFSPDKVAGFLLVKDWKGCWDYMRQLIESFSIKLDQSHNITIQKGFSDEEKRKYAEQFGGLMGELLFTLIMHDDARIDDENFHHLIYIHEVIHTFFDLAGIGDTDAIVQDILAKNKKLSSGQQKKIALLLSMKTNLDILSVVRKLSPEYRGYSVAAYLGYLKIYDEKIYDNKVRLYDVAGAMGNMAKPDYRYLISIISPYFSCSYLCNENKHVIKKDINKCFHRFFAQHKRELDVALSSGGHDYGLTLDPNKKTILVNWEYFSKGHAMLRVWGPWVVALEDRFNVVNMTHASVKKHADPEIFKNVVFYETVGDMVRIARDLKADASVLTSVGMTYWGIVASNLRLAETQIQLPGHPATTYSRDVDFFYSSDTMLDERAFPEDKLLSDKLPLTYHSRLSRAEIADMQPHHYQKNSGRPLKVSVIGSEIKVCAPFVQLLKDIESESDFEIEFSLHLGTTGMDTIYAERFFGQMFKNVKYYGWQPYDEYLKSMLETDIVLNPFPFGHTNTIIDSLIMGKPCIGLEGIEPASLTEAMILGEVGLRDRFSATSIDDYKEKFRTLSASILNGETEFFDRMDMFDKLHAPKEKPDYAQSMEWILDNAAAMKASPKKRFEIGEDF